MSNEVEQSAREMGWRPQAEFRGDTAKWVDANTYVSRGENFIPILRADREKLRGEVNETKAALAENTRLLQASQESLEELKRYHVEDTARQVDRAKKDLVTKLRQARDDGNVEAEVEIQDELARIRTAPVVPVVPAPRPAAAPAAPAAPQDPAFVTWSASNTWFATSPRLRGLTLGIAEELRTKQPDLRGKEFYDAISAEMAEYIDTPSPGSDKVQGGRGPSSGAGGGGGRQKGYADLSADAKAACDSYSAKLVGPGRVHKDLASWQASYAKDFFAGE